MAGGLSRTELVWLFAHELGVEFDDLDRFDGRKKFQKLLYLLQSHPFKKDFGFRYNLYVRGPYSPDLAASGYRVLEDRPHFEQVCRNYSLRDEPLHTIRRLRDAFQSGGQWDPDFLELCATVHYLYHKTYSYLSQPDRWDRVRAKTQELKPRLATKFSEAVDALARAGMVDGEDR